MINSKQCSMLLDIDSGSFAFTTLDSDQSILSSKEIHIFSSFSSKKRQQEFLAGRKACKQAFFQFTKNQSNKNSSDQNESNQNKSNKNEFNTNKPNKNQFNSYNSISILNNQNGSPFIEDSNIKVSISHSHNVAVAVVSNYNIGIDIELIDAKRLTVLRKAIVDKSYTTIEQLTVIWTLQEALSKAIHTGITKNFEFYSITDFSFQDGIYKCNFKHFPIYTGIATISNSYAIAIVQEQHTMQ